MRQGIDFRGEGGYVVAPPSIHECGSQYKWDLGPTTFAAMPSWLEEMVREKERPEASSESGKLHVEVSEWDGTTPAEVALLVDTIPQLKQIFSRDRRLKSTGGDPSACDFAVACQLYKRGIVDRRTVAFGVMASRVLDAEAWAGVARKKKSYFSDTVHEAVRAVNLERQQVADVRRGAHEALTSFEYPYNELGNYRRFELIHGADLLYRQTEKRWSVWDGKHFSDELRGGGDAGISQRIQAFLNDLWALPSAAAADPDAHEKAKKWVLRSGSASMLAAITSFAKGRLAIAEAQLDPDPLLLCTQNGMVDLQTGSRYDHDRKYRCTAIADAPYVPDAVFDDWDRFIVAVLPDPEERKYLQKCIGYSLLGIQPEQRFFFINGPTGTGKSTFIHAIQAASGSYHKTADFSTFLEQGGRFGGGSSPTPDLARLSRARIVSSIEVGHGQKLNTGLLKQISGGDTMATRGLHEGHQEWKPGMGLWLVANDRPKGRVDDDALWRRLVPFLFSSQVARDRMDGKLGSRLEGPQGRTAVLAWMIQGARDYLESGHLRAPVSIQKGVEDYRADSNPLTDFYVEACVRREGLWIKQSDLWRRYKEWCIREDVRGITKKPFMRIVRSDFAVTVHDGYPIVLGIWSGTQ